MCVVDVVYYLELKYGMGGGVFGCEFMVASLRACVVELCILN
jgi:hypothetical protein